MNQNRTPRLYALGLFLVVILVLYGAVLYDTQITHHEEYLTKSIHSITREEPVEASRGIITDRSGRTLVSNKSAYDLSFDIAGLDGNEEINSAALRLLELCDSQGLSTVDTLPISSRSPYYYTLDQQTDTTKRRFLTYLKSMEDTKAALNAYLLRHPELSPPAEGEEDAAQDPLLSAAERGDILLSRLPLSSFTTEVLTNAGLAAGSVLRTMALECGYEDGFPSAEQRRVLGVRYELALRRMNGYNNYILAENIDSSFISLINDGHFAGAEPVASSSRQYETASAAHVLGTVSRIYKEDLEEEKYANYDGDDWIGRSGVEAAFEEYLHGTDGKRIVSVNSDGTVTGEYYSVEPRPGNTVELTLDLELQQAVEASLAETVSAMNEADGLDSRGAGAAVIKVGTGEVLALASHPTFDLASYFSNYNDLANAPAMPLYNRATQGTYAPGSTFKPLTAIAALTEGVLSVTDRISSTGHWVYPGYAASYANCWIYNSYRGSHGHINVSQAITVSCNYFFAEMGYRLGMKKLNEYAAAFGLGRHTGIEIGDNEGSLVETKPGEDLSPWAGFGQASFLFSPIQLANYIATLVSGGELHQAHLLKTVKSHDNTEIIAEGNTSPVSTVQITEASLNAVKKGMHDLTTGSLSAYFKDCVVPAGAKTGTAQVGADTANNGVFVCFAPYDDPEIALAIVIEKGGSGSALASTAVNILNAYFSADEIGSVVVGENQLLP